MNLVRVQGTLITTPSGHIRYLPYPLCSPEADLLQEPDDDNEQSPSQQHLSGQTQFEQLLDFSFAGQEPTQNILDMLPPLRHCDALKTIFLDVFSPLLHIIHEPTFVDRYASFQQDPSSVGLSFLSLLFVIFATAIMTLNDGDSLLKDISHGVSPNIKVRHLAAKYQAAALKALSADGFLSRHNLDTVKTLLFLIYSATHTSGPSWSLLGVTLHIAVKIGCHVDPDDLSSCSIIEAEERRRCWHALLMLQTAQSSCIGVPSPIVINGAVRLPADMEDEDLINLSPRLRPTGQPAYSTSKMTYMLLKMDLYSIAAKMGSLVPSLAPDQAPQMRHYANQVLASIRKQESLFGNCNSLPVYHRAQRCILSIYSNHLLLVAYRSRLGTPSDASNYPAIQEQKAGFAQLCVDSALAVLKTYNFLCKEPSLAPYSWYTQGLGAFYALLAIVLLPASFKSLSELDDGLAAAVKDSLVQLAGNFQRLAHRSDTCARGLRFTKKLLYAQPLDRHSGNNGRQGSMTSLESGLSSPARSRRRLQPGSLDAPVARLASATSDLTSPVFLQDEFAGQLGWLEGTADVQSLADESAIFNFITQSSNQQWMSPAAFNWDQWQFI